MIAAVVIALMALAVAARSMVRVPEGSAYVVERLGRPFRTLSPGMHVLTPFIDRVAFRYSTLPRGEELSGAAVTHDNVPVRVTSTVRWRIADPRTAAYAAADVAELVRGVVMSAQRDWIAGRAWDDVRETTRELEAAVERSAAAAEGSGVELLAVTVRAIDRA